MKKLLIIFIMFLTLSTNSLSRKRYILNIDSTLLVRSYSLALTQVGVTEKTGKNDGPQVESYLKVVGLPKGYPYCAAGISWSFWCTAIDLKQNRKFIPFPLTASSQIVYDYSRKNGKEAIDQKSAKYDFFVWRKKDSYGGHIAWIDSVQQKGWVRTLEFNTSAGNAGSQRDGGGVYMKRRNIIHPLGAMAIRGFIGFNKIKGLK